MQRVYVSGLGAVTSFGPSVDELWAGLVSGSDLVQSTPDSWSNYSDSNSRVYVPFDVDTDTHPCPIATIEKIQHDPSALISMLSAYEALQNAGFELTPSGQKNNRVTIGGVDTRRLGVTVGSAVGGITNSWASTYQYQSRNLLSALEDLALTEIDDIIGKFFPMKKMRLNKFFIPKGMPNSVSDTVAMKFSAHAFSETVSLACASGTAAIGKAYQQIATGQADIIITGGSEYLTLPTGNIHKGFDLISALTTDPLDALRGPFDKNRTGFTFSEGGSAVMILESEAHLNERGGKPLAQIAGFMQNYECHSFLAIEPSGDFIRQLHHLLLKQTNCSPNDVDYINAHGSGTPLNDQLEADVIGEIYPQTTLVNSTKSLIGHTIGASGAIECVATVKQMLEGVVHPTANLHDPINGISLPTVATEKTIHTAISTSYAFGGHNTAVLLKSA